MTKLFSLIVFLVLSGCRIYLSPFSVVSLSPPAEEPEIIDQPFQIFYSELCHKKGFDAELKPWSKISLDDILVVEENGYLILQHSSGAFLEFDYKTEVSISDTDERLRRVHNSDFSKQFHQASLDILYSESPKPCCSAGAAERPAYRQFPLFFLISEQVNISSINPTICLLWVNESGQNPDSYILTVENIFDEVVDEFEVSDHFISVDFSDYDDSSNLFLIKVRGSAGELFSNEIGIKVDYMNEFVPHQCDPHNNAVRALELAYFLERHGFTQYARPYYELAADLSNRSIFQEMLKKYNLRMGGL